jgi:chromate reductase, NAD(P)H dehydrogenase (quinone)
MAYPLDARMRDGFAWAGWAGFAGDRVGWPSIHPMERHMSTIKVAVFVGSLRTASINRKLAHAVEKLAPDELSFEHVRIDNLPLYNQDFDKDYPVEGRRLKQQVEAADALLFVTPEYNRSIPGVLKNALDIGSRPWGTNSFARKPGAVLGASVGATGTALAQQHLRNVLAYLDVPLLCQPEVFIKFSEDLIDAEGNILNEGTHKFLQGFVDRYVAWLKTILRD